MTNLYIEEGQVKELTVIGEQVQGTIKVKRAEKAPEHKIRVVMDFSGIAPETIYKWAARTRIIDLQRMLRKCDEEFLTVLEKSVLHKHASEAGKAITDPNKAFRETVNQVSSMTPEQQQELLKALQAAQNANNQ